MLAPNGVPLRYVPDEPPHYVPGVDHNEDVEEEHNDEEQEGEEEEDGEDAYPDVPLQSTGAVASVLQGTSLNEDVLFVKFEGQQMHIQQLLNMLVDGHRNDMKVAVARFDHGASSIPGFVWAIPTPQQKPDAVGPCDVFFRVDKFFG